MQGALAGLLASGLQVVWLTGRGAFEGITAGLSGRGEQVRIYPYLEQMEQGYAVADLALCRAGATTIAELTCAGIPSILVPYPHAAADHQTENAKSVAEGGGALMVPDSEIRHRLLGEVTGLLENAERLGAMAARARALGFPGAAHTLAEAVLQLTDKRNG
jgi:UDP-N-acetylglucosamine--N-acetylmuramyl-(pentapeptide) pyrophosphoryl-undecaprenol N-acetylglucosamine transferase